MKESFEELEAELRSLRPLDVPDGLRERISGALGDMQPEARGRGRWARLVIGGALLAAAAGVLCVIALWPRADRGLDVPAHPEQLIAGEPDRSELPPPTLSVYRLALRESEEALNELLDQHAMTLRGQVENNNGDFMSELYPQYGNH